MYLKIQAERKKGKKLLHVYIFGISCLNGLFKEVPDGLRRQHLRDMKCTVRDLEVMGSNPSRAELGVHRSSVKVVLEPKIPQNRNSVIV